MVILVNWVILVIARKYMILANLRNRMVPVIIEILGIPVVLVNWINWVIQVVLVNIAILSKLVIVLDLVILKNPGGSKNGWFWGQK